MKGNSILIFPEGHCSPPDGMLPARSGTARLALETGAPIIPVGIHLDSSRIKNLVSTVEGEEMDGPWYFHGPYHITIGDPLYLEGSVEEHEHVNIQSGRIMYHIKVLADQSARRKPLRRPSLVTGLRFLMRQVAGIA
jgi:1-acyl-sn-glycerol-3-phosphate acyltransferase